MRQGEYHYTYDSAVLNILLHTQVIVEIGHGSLWLRTGSGHIGVEVEGP